MRKVGLFVGALSRRTLTLVIAVSVVTPCLNGEELSIRELYPQTEELSLAEYMQRVVDFNESVQSRLLGFHAVRRQRRAEMGTFEPALVTGFNYADRVWPLTDIGTRTQGWVDAALNAALNGQDPPPEKLYPYIASERYKYYSTDLEMQTPIGTRLRIGARANDRLSNFQQPTEAEKPTSGYSATVGVTIEQPLLRGLGFATNLASLRLAARESEIAFQDYRRQLMQVVSAAEMAYWELYYAQEALAMSKESVQLAQTLLEDMRARFESGKGSRLDVLEAEAGLATRRTRANDAFLNCVEAMNQMASFYGGVPRNTATGCIAADEPVSQRVEMSFQNGLEQAMQMNPDLLKAKLLKEQEKIRFQVARNGRLPELNVTAGLDFAGHGGTFEWDLARRDIKDGNFPGWTVGVVLRLPIWGDVRKRNEMWAAKLKLKEAERTESNMKTQLSVGRDTAEKRVDTNYATARSLEQVVEFRENLLETRLQTREVGRIEARPVLEAEQDLFEARLTQLKSEVECQRALLELQLISGNLLQLRNLEVTFAELEARSVDWAEGDGRRTPGMIYQMADPQQLSGGDPYLFGGDPAGQPWLGLDWQWLSGD